MLGLLCLVLLSLGFLHPTASTGWDCEVYGIADGNMKQQQFTFNWKTFRFERFPVYENVSAGVFWKHNSSLYLVCNDGYSFQGRGQNHVEISCLDGMWTPNPVCRSGGECEVHEIADGTLRLREQQPIFNWKTFRYETIVGHENVPPGVFRKHNSSLFLVCNDGYSFEGNGQNHVKISCLDGNWTPNPVCRSESFGRCPIIDNKGIFEVIYSNRRRVNSTARFFCKDATKNIDGSTIRTCLQNNEWSGSHDQTCIDSEVHCPEISKKEDLIIIYSDNRKVNSIARYICKDATKVVDGTKKTRVCLESGEWSGSDDQTCLASAVRCPVISSKGEFIIIYNDERKVNSIARYFCMDVTKRVVGPKIRICLETEEWSGSNNQTCRVKATSCPKFSKTLYLDITYSDEQNVGSIAAFHCFGPFTLKGSSFSTCLRNGTWTNHQPQCESISCPKFSKTRDIEITYSDEQNVGSIATFHCVRPLLLKGGSISTCLGNGTWSNTQPLCESRGCSVGTLMILLPTNVEPNMEDTDSENLPNGSEVELLCEGNLFLLGNKKVKCTSGTWDFGPTMPQCSLGCRLNVKASSSLIISPVKEHYSLGEFVDFSCPHKYTLTEGTEKVMCLGSTWSDSIPDCVAIK